MDLIDRLTTEQFRKPNSFENDCMLKLLHRRVDMLDNILVNVLGTVDMM